MLRKMLCRLLCCIAILCLTATSVFAYGYFNGSDRLGSISFDFSSVGASARGGVVELRMVAEWDDEAKALRWCEGYEAVGFEANEITGDKAAEMLLRYAQVRQIPAVKLELDAEGKARVEELPLGVYLVSQTQAFPGYELMLPSLVSVPVEIDGSWVFDVEATPKLEPLVPETTQPATQPSTEPHIPGLPQTGQVNWPVPMLFMGGCFLILLGLCLRKDRRDETDT